MNYLKLSHSSNRWVTATDQQLTNTNQMYFDRFDICEAHYLLAMLWHDGMGSSLYAKFAQFERIKFRPSRMLSSPRDLTENGLEIYEQLLETYGFTD